MIDITCPICSNSPVNHALDECGHAFCEKCIYKIDKQCPTCRLTPSDGFQYIRFYLP